MVSSAPIVKQKNVKMENWSLGLLGWALDPRWQYAKRYGAVEYGEKVYTVVQELQENIVKTIDVFDKEGIFYIICERIPTFRFICKLRNLD